MGGHGTSASSSTRLKVKRLVNSPHNLAPRATNRPVSYIVDSGTTLIYAPGALVEEVAQLFDPPGFYLDEYSLFFAYCDATPPILGLVVNGTAFYINGQDLLLQNESLEFMGDELCVMGLQVGDPG